MKKIIILLVLIVGGFSMTLLNSCAPTKMISEKSGAQLWGENCNRCHNAPSMEQYSKENWTVISAHMRVRANLTTDELNKVISFLQGQ